MQVEVRGQKGERGLDRQTDWGRDSDPGSFWKQRNRPPGQKGAVQTMTG